MNENLETQCERLEARCERCDRAFYDARALGVHNRMVHDPNRPKFKENEAVLEHRRRQQAERRAAFRALGKTSTGGTRKQRRRMSRRADVHSTESVAVRSTTRLTFCPNCGVNIRKLLS